MPSTTAAPLLLQADGSDPHRPLLRHHSSLASVAAMFLVWRQEQPRCRELALGLLEALALTIQVIQVGIAAGYRLQLGYPRKLPFRGLGRVGVGYLRNPRYLPYVRYRVAWLKRKLPNWVGLQPFEGFPEFWKRTC